MTHVTPVSHVLGYFLKNIMFHASEIITPNQQILFPNAECFKLFSKGSNEPSCLTPPSHQTLVNQRMKWDHSKSTQLEPARQKWNTVLHEPKDFHPCIIRATHQPASAIPLFVTPQSQYLILQMDMLMKAYGCLSSAKYPSALSFWMKKSTGTGSYRFNLEI